MAVKVHVEGLRELDKALSELSKATAKGVLRRVLLKAGKPIADTARPLAPDDPATPDPDLESSIKVGTKLSKRQASLARRERGTQAVMTSEGFRSAATGKVEVYVGPGPLPQAHLQEFGTVNHGPQPFMRPAWEAQKTAALDVVKSDLGEEIRKTAARAARRKAAKVLRAA